MKKTIFSFISFLSLMNYSEAQNTSFGITAGATFATYKAKAESISLTSKTKTGFTVGVMSSCPLGSSFSFEPALNFVQKGGKVKEAGVTDKVTLNYLELPLNFTFNMPSATGRFFIGAGPSFSMGLSGKDKWEEGSESGKEDIKFGNGDDDDLKAFEVGVNFLAGYQLNGGFLIAANYNGGVSNIANTDNEDSGKMHNRYFGIRIGYLFNGNVKPGPSK